VTEAHDAPRRAEAIRGCVFANDMEGAIRLMLDFARQFSGPQHADEVVLLSRDLREVDDLERNEKVEALVARKERRKIAQNLLDLLRLLMDRLQQELTHA
jgi:Effector-associated domain 11